MYHRPDTSTYRTGEVLTVADILTADVTIDEAYSLLPPDMRCPRDVELDSLLPWRRPAAVLRELHRRRAGEIVAGRACRSCANALVPELLTRVGHPSDPERTVTLIDSLLDAAGTLFELVAGSRPLRAVVDEFIDSTEEQLGRAQVCATPGCTGTARLREGGIPSFAVTVLALLASWAYEAGACRDTESIVNAAWERALEELRGSAEGALMTTTELLERASTDPRIVAAEAHVPSRWADSDWGGMVRLHGESPTLCEVAAAQDVRQEDMALAVVGVTNWLADRAGRVLAA
jgi:hypothetical protein